MSVNYFRIYCLTENKWVYGYLESDKECTVCFNNNTHSVNLESANLLTSISQKYTLISTDANGSNTKNFRSERKMMACAPYTVTTQTTIFPYDVSILSFNYDVTTQNIGDVFDVIVMPISQLGVLETSLSQGETHIAVSPFLIDFLNTGYQLVFTKASTGEVEETDLITNINMTNNVVTLLSGLRNSFAPGDYFSFLIKRITNFYMNIEGNYSGIGNYLRASAIPKVMKVMVRYNNKSLTNPKTFYYGSDILY